MKYSIEFTSKEIKSCKDCRLVKQVSKDYWESELMCGPYKRFVNRFYERNTKPEWCPLKESEEK